MRIPFLRRKKVRYFRRSPKLFVPTPSKWQIVIPFKPISVGLILFLFLVCLYLLFRSDIFLVKTVKCQGEIDWCLEVERNVLGRSILTLDLRKVESLVRSKFLAVLRVEAKKHPPSTLGVKVIGRKALAVVAVYGYEKVATGSAVPDGKLVTESTEVTEGTESAEITEKSVTPTRKVGKKFLVDGEGLIFAESVGDENLAQISLEYRHPLSLGDRFDSGDVRAWLEILEDLSGYNIAVEWIKEEKAKETLFKVRQGPLVFISLGREARSKISALHLILEKYKIEGKELKKVDLRFEKPVVVY